MQSCKRFLVSGRVQGVWYRASTRTRALELGLHGVARNLSDGRVEVIACGPGPALGELEAWLWEGPPAAEVADVEVSEHSAGALLPGQFLTA